MTVQNDPIPLYIVHNDPVPLHNKRNMKNKEKRHITKYWLFIIITAAVTAILNIAVWSSKAFCDWYISNIFTIWNNTFCRISGLFPFSVGEYMIILGVILSVLALVCLVVMLIVTIRKRATKTNTDLNHIIQKYLKVYLAILTVVCLIMTLNCSMLYHCTPIGVNKTRQERQFTFEELEALRNYIVEQCNYYAELMERDENGYVIYNGDMKQDAKQYMLNISDRYPRLKGYYPDVKNMMFSDLMSQSYMAGYYFPFSLEANVNANMYIVNYPASYCHELSHLHGYIYEEEADFLAFLACTESENDFFIYCGYIDVLNTVENTYIRALKAHPEVNYYDQPQTSELVRRDDIFLLEETWKKVEDNALMNTDRVNQISDTFVETSLKANGIEEGMLAYKEIVGMLLVHFEEKLK